MSTVTIIGAGTIGAAVHPAVTAGTFGEEITGDIVVLALPYPALADVVAAYAGQLAGKTVVDVTHPLDFATFDSLVVPADGSAAAELASQLPGASVLKAFTTSFAATLVTTTVGDLPTTVLVAGDDAAPRRASSTSSRPAACVPSTPQAPPRR